MPGEALMGLIVIVAVVGYSSEHLPETFLVFGAEILFGVKRLQTPIW